MVRAASGGHDSDDTGVGNPSRPATWSAAAAASAVVDDGDLALFEALKALRTRFAQEQGVPAYVVFSDRSLAEMATHRPGSLSALREIHGVGDSKLQRYGAEFLDVIARNG